MSLPRQLVRRAAVLGAGTMGSQIAALLADQGIPCDLLDLPSEGASNRLAEDARRRLTTLKPSPIKSADALELIRPGNFRDDLPRLREADWVIEAVVERKDVKLRLWGQVAPHLRPDAIASTNTSGIPIASIAEALPPQMRRRFLGTHFFNPPRYLRLLEIIPAPDTDASVLAAIRSFAEQALGKGVVFAHDVPGFITNRIGTYGLMVTLQATDEFGLGPDEVDSITGPAMGRPNSATFRTLDLVGIDIFVDICDNLRSYDPSTGSGQGLESWEREAFEVPPYLRQMLRRGWIGEKASQGFYRRVEEGGQTQILALQLDTLEYRPRKRLQTPSLAAIRNVDDAGQRLRTLVNTDDPSGKFAWRVLSQTLAYAARKVGEVADDIVSIDRAMRWGFGWELGPFETWDALGVPETTRRMQGDGLTLPGWVMALAKDDERFYRREASGMLQATPRSEYAPVPESLC